MKRTLLMSGIALLVVLPAAAEENWPQWRGPNLNGTAEGHNLPVSWSETENIVWKVPLPSWGGSTPVTWGDRIFLTSPSRTQSEDPARMSERTGGQNYNGGQVYSLGFTDPGGPVINLHCFSRSDGRQLWVREISVGNVKRMKQNMSSPSPVTDGRYVWVMSGNAILKAFDFEGVEIWSRDLQADFGKFGHNHGYGASPLLYKDRLILGVLHGARTDDPSYMLALDKMTGETLWRTERPTDAVGESPDSYATPQVVFINGATEIVINGGDLLTGHDPDTGEELWRAGGLNPTGINWNRMIASCLVVDDLVFVPKRLKPMLAFRAGGRGDVTDSHLAWSLNRGGADVVTPVSDGRYIWIVADMGIAFCVDVETGRELFAPQRIPRGAYTSSLVMADGKIYATNESAQTTVLAAKPEFEILSVNVLDDPYTLSSLVVSDDRLILRTSQSLYCIGEPAPPKGD